MQILAHLGLMAKINSNTVGLGFAAVILAQKYAQITLAWNWPMAKFTPICFLLFFFFFHNDYEQATFM